MLWIFFKDILQSSLVALQIRLLRESRPEYQVLITRRKFCERTETGQKKILHFQIENAI